MGSLGLLLIAIQLGVALSDFYSSIYSTCPTDLLANVDVRFLRVHNNACFYFVTDQKKTYYDARAHCMQTKGTLALVKTQGLNDFLVETLVLEFNYKRFVWIGLNDINAEGIYVWDDGTALEYNNFGPNVGNRGEDCVALEPDRNVWQDTECDKFDIWTFASGKYAYVCQYPSKAPTTEAPGGNTPGVQTTSAAPGGAVTVAPTTAVTPEGNVTSVTTTIVAPEDEVREEDGCPEFTCGLDCGMDGYKLDENECQTCECNV